MKERKDKLKNKAKVVKEAVVNPLSTQREVAKNAWVWLWTANRTIQELEQTGTKDDRILWICDKDLEIVTLWQDIILSRLKNKNELEKISARDVSWIIKENTARYTIFKWGITDKDGWMKWILTEEQQKALLDRFELDE